MLGFSGPKTFWSVVTQGMFVKQSMYNRILIDYVTNCTSTNVQTAFSTETLNHLKLKILWLQIDLTNLDQLEFEVYATILGAFWLQSWISLNEKS